LYVACEAATPINAGFIPSYSDSVVVREEEGRRDEDESFDADATLTSEREDERRRVTC
jgi:hypothetical protein